MKGAVSGFAAIADQKRLSIGAVVTLSASPVQVLLHTALTRLLAMAADGFVAPLAAEAAAAGTGADEASQADDAAASPWPRVHAFNILRLVVEEKPLATDTLPFLAQGAPPLRRFLHGARAIIPITMSTSVRVARCPCNVRESQLNRPWRFANRVAYRFLLATSISSA